MRTSLPGRLSRALATFLTGALVAGLTVGGVVAPAHAAAPAVEGGSATWNFVDSWSSYVTGPIAQGTITPAPGPGGSVYTPASGTYDSQTGTGTVHLAGSTRYEGHHGALDVTISDLTLELTGPTTGVLRADFSGTVTEGAGNDATVAEVTVAATRVGDDVTLTANGTVGASLAGVSSYFSMYSGRAIAPLTATFTAPEPVSPAVETSTTLAVSPSGTSAEGDAVTLSATVSPAAAGVVEFRDGGSVLGTAETAEGVARLEKSDLAVGDHALSAVFTPADPAAFAGSTSAAVGHAVTAVEPEPEPVADPKVTVTPSAPVDPAVENTFTVSGTGFVGDAAQYGAYVVLGDASIWDGSGPLVASGWLNLGWVQPRQIVDGAFTTTFTVPAGSFDPEVQYVVATSAAHGLSATDRRLDTFTPVAVQGAEPQEPVWEPSITVYAADGVTPLGDTAVRAGDEIVVKGSGFDPEANVGGRGMPIPATLPQGTYVVLGKFAEQWRPSEGVASSARKVVSQRWALAESVLDQVPAAFQQTIRDQWAEITPDGTFEATLTVAASDAEGRYGVYTYGAGGVTNADQELYAPVAFTTEPPAPVWEPAVEVFAADGSTPLGDTEVTVGDTVVVKGSGFDPAANVGGRGVPVPAHLPQGTYVVFGSFAEQWRPSEGAPSANRKVGSQVWGLAEPVLDQVPAQFQSAIRAQWADIAEDGTFEATLVVKNPAAIEGGRHGVYTYGAGGVTNADQELYVPVAYDAPAPLTVTPASSTVEPGTTVTLTVGGLSADDTVKDVTFGGKAATHTREGGTIVLTIPDDAVDGDVTVTVTSALGVSGSTTLTVRAPLVADPQVTVTPSSGIDPAVENTFTVSGTGFVGDAAQYGAYVVLGDASIWDGSGPLVASGWLNLGWVQPRQIVDGAFTTTFTVPAGSFDPEVQYVVATSAAHGLSATDRRLDTFTPLGIAQPAPEAQPTTTSLKASSASLVEGSAVTLTATVSPRAAGTVRFVAGSAVLGTATVVDGAATVEAKTLAVGTHAVTATFVPADGAAFLGSTSDAVSVKVSAKPTGPSTAGSLTWGVKESFRSYIVGPIAHGGASATAGAAVVDGLFRFGQAEGGTWSSSAGRGTVEYAGAVRFTGHDGLLGLALTNPVVDITGAGTARLLVDATSTGLDGSSFDRDGVVFATLALGTPTTGADGAVTYRGARATLTADGSAAFAGFYPAGTALDDVTFTIGAAATLPGGDGGQIGTPGDGSTGGSVDPARATLSVSQAAPGDEVTISGVGFGANEAGIRSEIRSTPQTLATGVVANAGGAASTTVTIPADVAPGEHTLALVGASHEATAPITIVGSGTTTGSGSGQGAAEEKCFAQGVNGATLTWGVSDRFRAYVTGPIAQGAVSTSGVRDNGTTFTWSGGKGSFNTDLGKGRASYGGTVSFSGHDGILDLQISNPRVVVDGSTGTLVVDVRSSDMEGAKSSSNGVAFASLDLSGARSTSGSTVTWSGAPATLTAAGAAAFAGFYDAGTALSPVTFSFPVGGDVECDVYSGLAATGSDGADVALTALVLLLTGTVLVGATTRRRARARVTA
ncbi:HtaA domain-containing protein [Cellulosimicrobium sp. Marseille-Q4280]|uniref:HtaA domain-containing protein n=1 Tax=Cellulosimicrobium sp. Marseille-Q4280 TaxID=2937992 RepID=UPI00203BB60D|nr:HtaA domain-containing protein [Cellulosimicrobium sp. Marseille-Q4280]